MKNTNEVIVELTHAQRIAKGREAKRRRGECAYCPEPVALRADGLPARLCVDHLEADRIRAKTGRGPTRAELAAARQQRESQAVSP